MRIILKTPKNYEYNLDLSKVIKLRKEYKRVAINYDSGYLVERTIKHNKMIIKIREIEKKEKRKIKC